MANRIWTDEQLLERTSDQWPLRARLWAVEELASLAPHHLRDRGPALLDPSEPVVLREAAASHLARHTTPEQAAEILDELEPEPPLLPLLLRARDPRGDKLARRFNAWWAWAQLHRDGFVAWLEGSKPDAEPELVTTIAENLVIEGVGPLVATVLRYDAVEIADEIGAYLHMAVTGMEGAFAEDAGPRGVAALRSPFFVLRDDIKARFQELGALPPQLPRARFASGLREIWGNIFETIVGDDHAPYEMLREVSLRVMTDEGPDICEAAARLANRAVAAGILRAGIDAAFAAAESDDERLEVWKSFAEAGFRRADQLLFHPDGDREKLVDDPVGLSVRALEEVTPKGLASALRIAWYAIEQVDADADDLAEPIEAAFRARLDQDDNLFELAIYGEGYRELIAAAPRAMRSIAEDGLLRSELPIVRETLAGLQASASAVAAELVADHLVDLLRKDPSPHAARALAILGSPEHLSDLVEAWAPGEPTLASYALSAAEIVGEPIDDAIAAEGEAAYEENRQTDMLTGTGEDLAKTLKTMRERFRAILRCTECGRVGRYDVPKVVIDPRGVEEHRIDGRILPNRPITCKFCEAHESYEVVDETNFYVYPHLIALRTGDDEARVALTPLELLDGTQFSNATEALEGARALAESGEDAAWKDLLRIAEIFADEETYGELRERAKDEAPAALEAFDATPSLSASVEEVERYVERAARSLERKERAARTKALKVGRYGVARAMVSDDGSCAHIGVAVVRKMPKGRVALCWAAINRAEESVVGMDAHYGLMRDEPERVLEAWQGPAFEPIDPFEAAQLVGNSIMGMVGLGRALPSNVIVHWPFFESLVKA